MAHAQWMIGMSARSTHAGIHICFLIYFCQWTWELDKKEKKSPVQNEALKLMSLKFIALIDIIIASWMFSTAAFGEKCYQ